MTRLFSLAGAADTGRIRSRAVPRCQPLPRFYGPKRGIGVHPASMQSKQTRLIGRQINRLEKTCLYHFFTTALQHPTHHSLSHFPPNIFRAHMGHRHWLLVSSLSSRFVRFGCGWSIPYSSKSEKQQYVTPSAHSDAAMSAKFCNFADNFIGNGPRYMCTAMPT